MNPPSTLHPRYMSFLTAKKLLTIYAFNAPLNILDGIAYRVLSVAITGPCLRTYASNLCIPPSVESNIIVYDSEVRENM